MRLIHATIMILLLSWSGIASSDVIAINPDAPERYVVVAGDTLWSISARFLRDPWRWPDIWVVNPQIVNPHLIYPGDQVVLTYKDGRPQLELQRGGDTGGTRTVKLEPRIRAMPTQGAIPTLSVDSIAPLLTHPGVMSDRELDKLPYIASLDDQHLVGGAGQTVYVRGLNANDVVTYRVIRRGEEYREPKHGKFLGVETVDVAEAVAERFGDPTTLRITKSLREIRVGDRIIPVSAHAVDHNFLPRAPDFAVDANIVGVVDGLSRIGQYQVVAISAGTQQKLEPGHVLAVQRGDERVKDPINEASGPSKFQLPDRRAGYLIVFRPFEKVSYALVMVAEHEIHLNDAVRTP